MGQRPYSIPLHDNLLRVGPLQLITPTSAGVATYCGPHTTIPTGTIRQGTNGPYLVQKHRTRTYGPETTDGLRVDTSTSMFNLVVTQSSPLTV